MINNNNISRFQFIFLLIHGQVGVSVIALPNEVFMIANKDGWISILLAGVLIQIMIFIYGMLMKRFPSYNFYEIIEIISSKWIAKIVILIVTLYFTYMGAIMLAQFSIIISAWMMPLTPKWALAALIILTSLYIAMENLQIIARFMFIAMFTFPIYIAFAIYALKDSNITYILPVGEAGILPIFQGTITTLYSIHGFELLLFVYPFIKADHRKIIKTTSYVNIFITLYYTFIVILSLLILSPEELKMVPEPVLYIVKSFSFKVLERPDLLITTLWIVIVVTTFAIIIYISSLGLSVFINKSRNKILVFIASALIFSFSLTINGIYELKTVSDVLTPFILFFIFILPTIFLILAILFNKKEGNINDC